ncbi:hypothetical protein HOG27_02060 [bacterium]|jgi:hypothetical protein|nr:hypothetical protein [bacterium]MBT5491174.1 hypothetical protein [bacterium]
MVFLIFFKFGVSENNHCKKFIGLNLNNIISDHKSNIKAENHVAPLQSISLKIEYRLKYAEYGYSV